MAKYVAARVPSPAAQLRTQNDQQAAQVERLKAELARLEGERDMQIARGDELTRLLDAAPRCEHCERTELLRRVLAVNLPAPILPAAIEKTIGKKEKR